jgi:hypothetical protein
MRALLLAATALLCPLNMAAQSAATVQIEFTHPSLIPAHWTLSLHPDGSGHFSAQRGDAPADRAHMLAAVNADREVQLSPRFAAGILASARRHNLFQQECESGRKVAFQGTKKLSYSGPEGQGSCTFNYSDDKEIQQLSETLQGVAETILAGARLELLLQHDRLGLDAELAALEIAAKENRAVQLCAIRGLLMRLTEDPALMERVRKRARELLARAEAEAANP